MPKERIAKRLMMAARDMRDGHYALVRVELVGPTHKTPAGDSLMLARLASRPEMPCFAVGEEDLVEGASEPPRPSRWASAHADILAAK